MSYEVAKILLKINRLFGKNSLVKENFWIFENSFNAIKDRRCWTWYLIKFKNCLLCILCNTIDIIIQYSHIKLGQKIRLPRFKNFFFRFMVDDVDDRSAQRWVGKEMNFMTYTNRNIPLIWFGKRMHQNNTLSPDACSA